MRLLRHILLLATGLSFAPATAQTGDYAAIGMQIHNGAGREPIGDPKQTHASAMCLAFRDGTASILAQLPHSRRESAIVAGTFTHGNPRCYPKDGKLLIGGRFLRGAAAEYLLEHQKGPPTGVPLFKMPDPDALQGMDPNIRAPIVFIQIGECTARANPNAVTALLATEVGSPEERSAFSALVPAMGGCVPGGVSFRLPPLLVRGYLAEGAYRVAAAAVVGDPS
jgi:hypothetical protein